IRTKTLPEDAGWPDGVDEVRRNLVNIHGRQRQFPRQITDVAGLDYDAARDLALDTEIKLLRIAGMAVRLKEVHIGGGIASSSYGSKSGREGVAAQIDRGHPVAQQKRGRDAVVGRAEAG